MSADLANIEAQIDPREALAGLGFADISEPRRVKGGWDTLLWRFGTPDGRNHSLRVFYLPGRNEIALRERVALETCATAGLPAPRIEKIGEIQELPAMVLSWCPGIPILAFMEKKPWTLWRLGRLFGRTQAKLHAVTPPDEFVTGAPNDWVSRVTQEYADLAVHALSLGLSTSSLIHMDYHPLNVVSDGATVTGILDWSGAAAGDPRADLARTEITLLAAPVPPGPLSALFNLARSLILRAWRSGYEEVAGPMPDFQPLRAWAGATFLAETEGAIDRPHVWGTQEDIELLRRKIDVWAREADIR
ncbi:MAG: aminoglycoside phosphotransferase family protein [Chloroflexi bacterium]|nr:aminoglycoside phosphotransferase family protein [Chloroflexota bacterium]